MNQCVNKPRASRSGRAVAERRASCGAVEPPWRSCRVVPDECHIDDDSKSVWDATWSGSHSFPVRHATFYQDYFDTLS